MPKKILLIEDDPDIHLMIKYVLMRAGYELDSAYDGVEGLQKITEANPDLIILDNMMPKLGGIEVFRKIHADDSYKPYRHIPIIMLTARQTDEKRIKRLLEAGLAAFLYKPFGQNELLNVIQNILTTHQIQLKNKQLLKATREAKDFMTILIENIPDALFILDMDCTITYYNGGFNSELGYGGDLLINKPFSDIIDADASAIETLRDVLEKKGRISNMEISLINVKGESVPFRISASEMRSKNDKKIGYIVIGSDISEIKQLEHELVEKEKLAMLTETAIAVNHEINNPLSPILGSVQMLLRNKEKYDEQTIHRLEVIQRNAVRIQEITKKLRKIKHPVKKAYVGKTKMLDIHHSS